MTSTSTAFLHVGDTVMWRGGFGNEEPRKARVTGIEWAPDGDKYGMPVESVPWADRFVVDLDNGHWAYSDQLESLR